jgi:hypothetical protein
LNDEFIYHELKVLFPYVEGTNEPERASLLVLKVLDQQQANSGKLNDKHHHTPVQKQSPS